MDPPEAVKSAIRAAGNPPIITVAEPLMMASAPQVSLMRAAGNPPISTVGAPGGIIGTGDPDVACSCWWRAHRLMMLMLLVGAGQSAHRYQLGYQASRTFVFRVSFSAHSTGLQMTADACILPLLLLAGAEAYNSGAASDLGSSCCSAAGGWCGSCNWRSAAVVECGWRCWRCCAAGSGAPQPQQV